MTTDRFVNSRKRFDFSWRVSAPAKIEPSPATSFPCAQKRTLLSARKALAWGIGLPLLTGLCVPALVH
jgi:hypothetical protein